MWTHNIGIQIKQNEPTKTFMIISNWKNPLVSMVDIHKYFTAVMVSPVLTGSTTLTMLTFTNSFD